MSTANKSAKSATGTEAAPPPETMPQKTIAQAFPLSALVLSYTCALAACHTEPPSEPASATPSPAVSTASTPAPPPSSAPTPAAANEPELPQSEIITFQSDGLTLKGQLYRPRGPGPFPAVVYNHGSEKNPVEFLGQVSFYTSHGYVLFTPHRRGHGMSQGTYFDDIASQSSDPPGTVTRLLSEQVHDVAAAVATVRAMPFVDASRVAVAGCSFGGIESLLAAQEVPGIRAAIDFAGGAMSWDGNPSLRDRMAVAAQGAKVPVLFLQAENDFSTEPSRALADLMSHAGKSYEVHVFPPNGRTHMEGHAFCSQRGVHAWGPVVTSFLDRNMGRPSSP